VALAETEATRTSDGAENDERESYVWVTDEVDRRMASGRPGALLLITCKDNGIGSSQE